MTDPEFLFQFTNVKAAEMAITVAEDFGSSDQERAAWASKHAETFGAADMQRIHETYEANEAKFRLDFVGRRFSANLPINKIFADDHWTQLFLGEGGIRIHRCAKAS